jgi:hydroxymethylpyrimidine kinase/phosphomethylpyrimidine kinase
MRATARPPVVLTIAGSDPSGGAGLQADLKTFMALGVHGVSAVTALTSQNSMGVHAVWPVPPPLVAQQIQAVVEDMGCQAAKTGMLAGREVVEAVAEVVRGYRLAPLVVDPVLKAASGEALLTEEGIAALVEHLIPLATVLTPNLPEAERLVGRPLRTMEDVAAAARELGRLGAQAVVIKGGHSPGGEATDVLWQADGDAIEVFGGPRLPGPNPHGTGCIFSAALAAELSKGRTLAVAVRRAKSFVTAAIRYRLRLGQGRPQGNILAASAMVAAD